MLFIQIQEKKKKRKYLHIKDNIFLVQQCASPNTFLTPLDESFIVKFIGHQLFQEHALFFFSFCMNSTSQTCNATFCIMVGFGDWFKNIYFLAFITYKPDKLLMLQNSLGCMNDGDFCVIPDKVEDTENSFNPLFILCLYVCGTSSDNCYTEGTEPQD